VPAAVVRDAFWKATTINPMAATRMKLMKGR
jgi:hypothetical protein